MVATGNTSAVYFGMADATIVLTGSGRAADVALGQGNGDIRLTGLYGIPAFQPVPDAYHPAPLSRFMAELGDERLIRVDPEPVLPVRENRTTLIQKEGRRA
jgi:hypothetical protein